MSENEQNKYNLILELVNKILLNVGKNEINEPVLIVNSIEASEKLKKDVEDYLKKISGSDKKCFSLILMSVRIAISARGA